MKRMSIIASVLLLGNALGIPVAHAGGQPPASGAPLGATLLQGEQAAVQRAGSFHLDGQLRVVVPGQSRVQLHLVADIGVRPVRLHEIVTLRATKLSQQPAATTTRTIEEVASGQTLALRAGTAAWHCRSVASLQQMVQSLIGTPQLTSAQTMGTGMVGGTKVWLVRVMITLSLGGMTDHLPVTYAIAQSTDLPLLASASFRLPVNGQMVREQLLFHYSNFGEPVNATLPAACPKALR